MQRRRPYCGQVYVERQALAIRQSRFLHSPAKSFTTAANALIKQPFLTNTLTMSRCYRLLCWIDPADDIAVQLRFRSQGTKDLTNRGFGLQNLQFTAINAVNKHIGKPNASHH